MIAMVSDDAASRGVWLEGGALAAMKPGASTGCTPAKVSLKLRASVMAGLANEVDAVHQ